VLKLILTPVLIGGASLGARRWGPTVGGWIVSLPLTSGPVVLFLALDRGPAFAAAAAEASLAGCVAIAAYGVAYARAAGRDRWTVALAAGTAAWLLAALAVQPALRWPVPLLFGVVGLITVLALQLLPAGGSGGAAPSSSLWDVPLRMAVGTAVVVLVTAAAPVLGAGTSGILAMLPIIGSILAVFAQRAGGAAHGIAIQRGILSGQIGTAAFLAVVGGSIEGVGIAVSFGIALLTVVLVQAGALVVLRARPADRSTDRPAGLLDPSDAPVRPTLS